MSQLIKFIAVIFFSLSLQAKPTGEPGNVIFFHPDGMGVSLWGAVRISTVGPDGRTEWDKLPAMAVYTGHMKDSLSATSNGGATVHAYGVKVPASSFGMSETKEIKAASGKKMSILEEAKATGVRTGLVQTGSITEPGTAAFIASVPKREDHDEIAKQVVLSGIDVLLSGGEQYLLPKGIKGRFGEGTRTDNLNLIDEAKKLGYTIVYTEKELLAVPLNTQKLLGVFAANHTFNDLPEEDLKKQNLPLFTPTAPSIAKMTEVAAKILSHDKTKRFFLVAEEEGTDNFGNRNNAKGTLEAGKRADAAIGAIRNFIDSHPNTTMIMTSDSDAGSIALLGPELAKLPVNKEIEDRDLNGAPYDGTEGSKSKPFLAAPDKSGKRLPFVISWASNSDVSGGILVRGVGEHSYLVQGVMDNTDIYKVLYQSLFGKKP